MWWNSCWTAESKLDRSYLITGRPDCIGQLMADTVAL